VNLENLFDTDDDPISQDLEFTKAKGWTDDVYAAKRAKLASVLNELHGGLGPELLGVAEVEGDKVFAQLLADTGNPHLKVVTDPTPPTDLRAIDVSIAYDDRKLRVVDQTSHMVHLRYPTRDIFEVTFEVVETSDPLVVIASHWPSRRQGKEHSEPSRMTVAENIAFLVRGPCPVPVAGVPGPQGGADHGGLQRRALRCQRGRALLASSELDRVVGPTNQITKFEAEVATYRGDDTWLYNACWKFLAPENLGTFFIESTGSGEHFANRYQVLDNLVASRGLLRPGGVTLDPGSVDIYRAASVATPSGRPRPFNKKTKKGTSDHLPVIATLTY
jgi:hypothetical protein